MKVLAKYLLSGVFLVLLSGCASDFAYVPKIPPHAQEILLEYERLPDNKVFVIAVDPNGDFAAGYESGQATRDEAYRAAMIMCKENKQRYGVLAPAHVYAVNDTVVYERDIQRAHAK